MVLYQSIAVPQARDGAGNPPRRLATVRRSGEDRLLELALEEAPQGSGTLGEANQVLVLNGGNGHVVLPSHAFDRLTSATSKVLPPWYLNAAISVPFFGGITLLAGLTAFFGRRYDTRRREAQRLEKQMYEQEYKARLALEAKNTELAEVRDLMNPQSEFDI